MLKPQNEEEQIANDFETISKLNNENNTNSISINKQTNSTQKRHVRFQEQDGLPRAPGSRPSSAPAEPNAKAAKKAYKKMEKEQR